MNEVGSRFGQKGRTAFGDALAKGLVRSQNEAGIKLLKPGTRIGGKSYQYELKVFGEYSDWRIYGNINDKGQYIFDLFGKGLHK